MATTGGSTSSNKKAALAALAEGAAGAVGSMASILALYPLDTARTILQVGAPPYDKPMAYLELVRHIIRTEGWQRLYRGMPSAISGTGLSWALYFGWHEAFKRWMLSARRRKLGPDASLGAAHQMLAAAMAGILTTLVVNPIWVINTRIKLAAQKRRDIASADTHAKGEGNVGASSRVGGHDTSTGKNKPIITIPSSPTSTAPDSPQVEGAVRAVKKAGTIAQVLELVKREGIMGWLSGIVPALILLINPAIQLLTYARLRKMVLQAKGGKPPSAGEAALIGAMSKFLAVLFTFPAQTVKLRMQAGLKIGKSETGLMERIAAAKTFGAKLSEVLLLWTGVGSKMITSMLHSAVMFSVVEVIRALNVRLGKRLHN